MLALFILVVLGQDPVVVNVGPGTGGEIPGFFEPSAIILAAQG